MIQFKQKEYSDSDRNLFLGFINKLEGYKTRIKNLHWAAPKKNIHVYLDEFLVIVSDFQDSLAETYMGILGKMQPDAVHGIPAEGNDALTMINHLIDETEGFYEEIPEDTGYKGISSETETFIKDLQKYKYLFSLCDTEEGN